MDYEEKMIKEFVRKPNNPQKEKWYVDTFTQFSQNNSGTMNWRWSWWAFFLISQGL